MKLVVISDIHIHRWPYGDPDKRLENTVTALHAALMEATRFEADLVAVTGDIFHTPGRISTPVLEATYRTFKSFKNLNFVFVPGNHDETHRGQEQNAMCFLEEFGSLITFDKPHVDMGKSWIPRIHGLPYTEDEDQIKKFLEQCDDGSLVLMHQGVQNVEMNSKGFVLNEGIDPSWVPETIFGLFTGHYHSHRRFTATGTIPGALVQHNFGDVGDPRGFLVVEGEKDPVIRQLESSAYRFFDVEYSETVKKTLQEASRIAADNFVRIKNVPPKLIPEMQLEISKDNPWAADPMILPMSENFHPETVKVDLNNNLRKLLDQFIEVNEFDKDLADVGRELLNSAIS